MKIHRRPHKGSGLIVQRFKTANPSVYVYLAVRQQNSTCTRQPQRLEYHKVHMSTHPKYHPGCTRVRRLKIRQSFVPSSKRPSVLYCKLTDF